MSQSIEGYERLSILMPRLFLGPCPERPWEITALKERGITATLSLQTADDRRLYRLDWEQLLRAYEQASIVLVELPIADRDEQSLIDRLPLAVCRLDELLAQRHCVYLHCNIGNGRSPTVAAAWLSWKSGWHPEAAVEHVRQCRRCEPNLRAICIAGSRQVGAHGDGERSPA